MDRRLNFFSAIGMGLFAVILVIPVLVLNAVKGVKIKFAKELVIGQNQSSFARFKLDITDAAAAETEQKAPFATSRIKLKRVSGLNTLLHSFNIISGKMKLIGPRLGSIADSELTDERQRQNIYDSKPGVITPKSNLNPSEQTAIYDQRYIAWRSISIDIKLIISKFKKPDTN